MTSVASSTAGETGTSSLLSTDYGRPVPVSSCSGSPFAFETRPAIWSLPLRRRPSALRAKPMTVWANDSLKAWFEHLGFKVVGRKPLPQGGYRYRLGWYAPRRPDEPGFGAHEGTLCAGHPASSADDPSAPMMEPITEQLIELALTEDAIGGDITSAATVPATTRGRGTFVAKSPGVISGLDVARRVFQRVDPEVVFTSLVGDGSRGRGPRPLGDRSGSSPESPWPPSGSP